MTTTTGSGEAEAGQGEWTPSGRLVRREVYATGLAEVASWGEHWRAAIVRSRSPYVRAALAQCHDAALVGAVVRDRLARLRGSTWTPALDWLCRICSSLADLSIGAAAERTAWWSAEHAAAVGPLIEQLERLEQALAAGRAVRWERARPASPALASRWARFDRRLGSEAVVALWRQGFARELGENRALEGGEAGAALVAIAVRELEGENSRRAAHYLLGRIERGWRMNDAGARARIVERIAERGAGLRALTLPGAVARLLVAPGFGCTRPQLWALLAQIARSPGTGRGGVAAAWLAHGSNAECDARELAERWLGVIDGSVGPGGWLDALAASRWGEMSEVRERLAREIDARWTEVGRLLGGVSGALDALVIERWGRYGEVPSVPLLARITPEGWGRAERGAVAALLARADRESRVLILRGVHGGGGA